MNTTLLFGFLIGAFALLLFIIRQWFNKLEEKTRSSADIVGLLQDVSRRIDMTNNTVDQKLSRNMDMFNNRLDSAARVIGDVQKSIGQFSEIGRSMQQLQQFLRALHKYL